MRVGLVKTSLQVTKSFGFSLNWCAKSDRNLRPSFPEPAVGVPKRPMLSENPAFTPAAPLRNTHRGQFFEQSVLVPSFDSQFAGLVELGAGRGPHHYDARVP